MDSQLFALDAAANAFVAVAASQQETPDMYVEKVASAGRGNPFAPGAPGMEKVAIGALLARGLVKDQTIKGALLGLLGGGAVAGGARALRLRSAHTGQAAWKASEKAGKAALKASEKARRAKHTKSKNPLKRPFKEKVYKGKANPQKSAIDAGKKAATSAKKNDGAATFGEAHRIRKGKTHELVKGYKGKGMMDAVDHFGGTVGTHAAGGAAAGAITGGLAGAARTRMARAALAKKINTGAVVGGAGLGALTLARG